MTNSNFNKMATATFRLRNAKTDKATIYVNVSFGRGKQYTISTGLTINPQYWKSTNKSLYGFPKKMTSAEIKNLRADLQRLESHLMIEVNIANSNGEILNKEWLKDEVNKCFNRPTEKDEYETEKGKLIYQIQKFIDNGKTHIQKNGKLGLGDGRLRTLKTFKKVMLEFEQYHKKELLLIDFDYSLEQKLDKWLNEVKKYAKTTAGDHKKNLKVIVNYAKRQLIDVNKHCDFIRVYKLEKSKKIIQTLSLKELEQIENWQTDDERLDNARKWILIGCNIGQRVGDLLKLNFNNFVSINNVRYIEIRQEKTEKQVLIPINDQLKRVLSTGLPYQISDVNLNKYIKEVCKLVGIVEEVEGDLQDTKINRKVRGIYPKYKLITTHCFRRSYATNYYIHIPTPVIMEVTGHSKESTFLEYINKTSNKVRNANLMLEMMNKVEQMRKDQKTKVVEFKKAN